MVLLCPEPSQALGDWESPRLREGAEQGIIWQQAVGTAVLPEQQMSGVRHSGTLAEILRSLRLAWRLLNDPRASTCSFP